MVRDDRGIVLQILSKPNFFVPCQPYLGGVVATRRMCDVTQQTTKICFALLEIQKRACFTALCYAHPPRCYLFDCQHQIALQGLEIILLLVWSRLARLKTVTTSPVFQPENFLSQIVFIFHDKSVSAKNVSEAGYNTERTKIRTAFLR